MAKHQNPTTQAPKTEDAAKAAKAAKRAAKRAKRVKALQDLAKEDGVIAALCRLSFREFRHGVMDVHPTPKDAAAATWKAYCEFKAQHARDYWLAQAEKPQVTEKALARKKARLEKAKAKLAALEAELAQLGQ